MLCVSCTVGKHDCVGPVSHIPCDCPTCPYKAAAAEWSASEDSALWESTVGDGIEEEVPRDTLW